MRYHDAMDLHHLEIFCHVFEDRSFSAAGRRLDLSQPTVSVHVKTLEEELGVVLFNRLGREVEATDAGHFLYPRARRLLDLRQEMLGSLEGFRNRLEGDLEIGASTIPGEYLLPSILGRFHAAHPQVRLRLRIKDTGRIVEDVEAGRVQFGVVGAQLTRSDLEFQELARDRLVLIAPPDPLWARRGSMTLEDLAAAPLLLREAGSGTRMRLERWLGDQGVDPAKLRVVAELGSTAAVKEAVKGGLGVSFVSDLAVRSEAEAGLLTVLPLAGLEPVERRFFLVADRRRARSPLTSAFLELLEASRFN